MTKLVLGAVGLTIMYMVIARTGAPEAALWLTGAAGCVALVTWGLSRA